MRAAMQNPDSTSINAGLRRLTMSCGVMLLLHACAPSNQTAMTREIVAPSGTLRAGINLGNPVLAVRDSPTDEPRGVAVDIAREVAARIEAPLEFVTYDSAAQMAAEASSGKWDLAFLGADPAREAEITFTAPYVTLEATYLVPAGSRLVTPADVDAAGVRIAARPRSAYDLALRRILTRAQLVYPEAGETDLDLITSGRADALASLRDVLANTAASMPGSRVLDGQFATIQQAIGVPKGRAAASAYLQEFLADIKKSGFVAEAIRRTGARGASPAP
jgi:polar amino acid transport system substrate-binding protein